MFEQNYGSKDTRWLFWFMGVMAVYGVLTMFPQTEKFADRIGTVLAAAVAVVFRSAIGDWIKDTLFHSSEK